MLETIFLVVASLFAVLAACLPIANPLPPRTRFQPNPTEELAIPVTGMAIVQSGKVQIATAQPFRSTSARGQLPDSGCTTIAGIDQTRNGSTFQITLTTTTDPLALWALSLTPHEKVNRRDTTNLPPARNVVNANGAQQALELLPSDKANFKQALVQALNAKEYKTWRLCWISN